MALGFSQATEVNQKVVHCCKADGVGLIKFDLHSKQPYDCHKRLRDCKDGETVRYNWEDGVRIQPDKRHDFRYGADWISSMKPYGNDLYYYHGNEGHKFSLNKYNPDKYCSRAKLFTSWT